jgi:hypothetical protein
MISSSCWFIEGEAQMITLSMWLVVRDEYDGEHSFHTPLSVWRTEADAETEATRLRATQMRGSWTTFDVEEVAFEPKE